MTWIKCKERMPEPGKVVECRGSDCRGGYQIKLKWELYKKPTKKKLGRWLWEDSTGGTTPHWYNYPQWREIVEWRKIEEKERGNA